MSYPPLPNNGDTQWGDTFRAWADALEGRKVEGAGLTLTVGGGTVGDRVFINNISGTTMIYGDTGWRYLSRWDAAGTVTGQQLSTSWQPIPNVSGHIAVRRIGRQVHFSVMGLERLDTTTTTVWESYALQPSFRPDIAIAVSSIMPGGIGGLIIATTGAVTRPNGPAVGANGFVSYNTAVIVTYTTAGGWPSVLPGTP